MSYLLDDQGNKRSRYEELGVAVPDEAMWRSRQQDRAQAGAWLLGQFQNFG